MDFSIPESALEGLEPTDGKKNTRRKQNDEDVYKTKLTKENNYHYEAKLRLLYKPKSPTAIMKVMRHYIANAIPGETDNQGRQKMWVTSTVCPKTFGEKCPICENAYSYKDLYSKTKDKRFDDLYLDRRPTTSYLTNVYVINDKNDSRNNGTVKAWYMSPGVYKKVQDLMFPKQIEVDDEEFATDVVEKIIPFHPTEGVNMMLVANHDEKGWQSYENTAFSKKITPLADDMSVIESILSECHDFDKFVKKDDVGSYEALAERLRVHDEKTKITMLPVSPNVVEGATSGPDVEVPENHKRENTVVSGDSDTFFGDDIDDDEFSMPTPSTDLNVSSSGTSFDASSSDDDDDDLPF